MSIGYPPFLGVYIGQGSDANPQDQAQQQGTRGGRSAASAAAVTRAATPATATWPPRRTSRTSSGTLVLGTICGGPAAAAGMSAGSVITAVNGQAVGAPDSLTGVVSKYHPGQDISVTWVSPSGQRATSSLKLTAGPPQ